MKIESCVISELCFAPLSMSEVSHPFIGLALGDLFNASPQASKLSVSS